MLTAIILYCVALVFIYKLGGFLWEETVKRWDAWKEDDYWKTTEGEWQDMEQPFGSTGED